MTGALETCLSEDKQQRSFIEYIVCAPAHSRAGFHFSHHACFQHVGLGLSISDSEPLGEGVGPSMTVTMTAAILQLPLPVTSMAPLGGSKDIQGQSGQRW